MCITDTLDRSVRTALATGVLLATLAACGEQSMDDQARLEPLEATNLFPDGQASRPIPEATVAFGGFRENLALHTGMEGDEPVRELPMELTMELVTRGRERYDIFCSPCHDHAGTGNGLVVQRGFRRRPPSFHVNRLRDAPISHYFDVITNGFGAMLDYRSQIPPADRWAIAAYVRALQLSQSAPIDAVPDDIRTQLEATRQ